jgi:hypothetical protein
MFSFDAANKSGLFTQVFLPVEEINPFGLRLCHSMAAVRGHSSPA